MILLSDGRTLLALEGSRLFRSRDVGCSWIGAGVLPYAATSLHAAADGRAFAVEGCCIGDTSAVVRIDGDEFVRLPMPRANIAGFGTDPADRDRVRAAFETYAGLELWESLDGGGHWRQSGAFVCAEGCNPGLWKLAFFDPADLDHVVATANGTTPLFSSRDGGKTWTPATGLRTFGTDAGVWSVTFSPADPGVLWAAGIERLGDTVRRSIWRSADGGATFRLEVEEGDGISIAAKTRVTPSRTSPNLGWFGHGDMFGATWLYRHDTATRTTTIRERHLGFNGIEAIVQSTLRPDALRLLFTGPHCEALCLP